MFRCHVSEFAWYRCINEPRKATLKNSENSVKQTKLIVGFTLVILFLHVFAFCTCFTPRKVLPGCLKQCKVLLQMKWTEFTKQSICFPPHVTAFPTIRLFFESPFGYRCVMTYSVLKGNLAWVEECGICFKCAMTWTHHKFGIVIDGHSGWCLDMDEFMTEGVRHRPLQFSGPQI